LPACRSAAILFTAASCSEADALRKSRHELFAVRCLPQPVSRMVARSTPATVAIAVRAELAGPSCRWPFTEPGAARFYSTRSALSAYSVKHVRDCRLRGRFERGTAK
jgi:hypothetical protein